MRQCDKRTPGTGSLVHFEINRLQEGETVDYRWVDRDTLVGMREDELLTKRIQKFVKELSGAAVVAPA